MKGLPISPRPGMKMMFGVAWMVGRLAGCLCWVDEIPLFEYLASVRASFLFLIYKSPEVLCIAF